MTSHNTGISSDVMQLSRSWATRTLCVVCVHSYSAKRLKFIVSGGHRVPKLSGFRSFSFDFYIEFENFFTKSLVRLIRRLKSEVKIDHRVTGKWIECNLEVRDVSPSEF